MGKIVSLRSFKEKQASERGYRTWRLSFKEDFDVDTKVTNISDRTLAFLLKPGVKGQALLYDLIMGALGLGSGAKFFYLEGDNKMKVLDISLLLLDQVRFECMRRLGWICDFPGEKYTLLELINDFDHIKDTFTPRYPTVLESNPEYEDYQQRYPGDQEMFIRRQIPQAIDLFTRKYLKEE